MLFNMLNDDKEDSFHMNVIRFFKHSISARNQIKNTHTSLTLIIEKAVDNLIRVLRISRKYLDETIYLIIID